MESLASSKGWSSSTAGRANSTTDGDTVPDASTTIVTLRGDFFSGRSREDRFRPLATRAGQADGIAAEYGGDAHAHATPTVRP